MRERERARGGLLILMPNQERHRGDVQPVWTPKPMKRKGDVQKRKWNNFEPSSQGGDGTPNSSLAGSANDLHLSDTFQLSPQDFRARTSSNASSIGGRLSPIHSALEPDLHDNQVPPMSPIPWTQDSVTSTYKSDGFIPDNITESLAEMFVGDSLNALSPVDNLTGEPHMSGNLAAQSPLQSQLSPNSNLGFNESNGLLPAPPPYPTQRQSPNQRSPQNALLNNSLSPIGNMGNQGLAMTSSIQSAMMNTSPLNSSGSHSPFMSPQHQMSGGDMLQAEASLYQQQGAQQEPSGGLLQQQDPTLSCINSMPMDSNSAFQSGIGMGPHTIGNQPHHHQQATMYSAQQQQQQQRQAALMNQLNNSLLRQALTQKAVEQQQAAQQQRALQQQQQATSVVGTINAYPPDIDFSMDFKPDEQLHCDVDQIINHELSFDGNLDFNFDPQAASQSQTQQQQGQSSDSQYNIIQT